MKPDVSTAMRNLIEQARAVMPFDADDARLCSDSCQGCSKKLLEFLECELEGWEYKLDAGEKPNLGDIQRMGKTCKKVYAVLQKNGLLE